MFSPVVLSFLRNSPERLKEEHALTAVSDDYSEMAVLPIKLRSGMVTMVTLPAGEQIVDGIFGDNGLFKYEGTAGTNIMYLQPLEGVQGGDTNLIIHGKSGNKYIFYLRAEPSNSSETTYSRISSPVWKEANRYSNRSYCHR